ncbi:hypothetical protein [Heyndrickxia camelliae]|uniref:Uncharacterized protein n=1 Tax=Heyndrickxia camelliae TaxID=1707093 RepID=A0A2N3LE18_9BACI|nr:hypothetical protein [Heyndrickxia camelliae]PKR82890.1 hypothetical protein CWO92_22125 [Heyndrickxia camelliae]
MIKLEKGQIWRSKLHPHEDFKIYDVIVQEWDHHLTETFYCWERLNHEAFVKMVADRKRMTLDEFIKSTKTTHPFAWCGESQRNVLMNKIKKCEMELSE